MPDAASESFGEPTQASFKKSDKVTPTQSEDEMRLARCGYKQEVKRIFGLWTNFGLAASMISVLLGVIPLYTYSLTNGGKRSCLYPIFTCCNQHGHISHACDRRRIDSPIDVIYGMVFMTRELSADLQLLVVCFKIANTYFILQVPPSCCGLG